MAASPAKRRRRRDKRSASRTPSPRKPARTASPPPRSASGSPPGAARRRRRRDRSRSRSRNGGRSPCAASPPPRRGGGRGGGGSPRGRRRRSGSHSQQRPPPRSGSRSRGGYGRRRSPPRAGRGPRGETKPEGCRTVWIGWTDEKPKEEDLVEFFRDCGAITEIRLSDHNVRGYFAHVTFEDTHCVDRAMLNQNHQFLGKRISLDYAYMDKAISHPGSAEVPGRVLRCKPKSAKPPNGHTLWLGDLSMEVTEQDCIDLFEPCGKIEMICLKVNQLRNGHFGHVKFFETEAVDKAVELAGTLLKGVPIRMDYAEDKPLQAYRAGKDSAPESRRPEDCRTIWVGGLPNESTREMIQNFFEGCGEILEIRLDNSKRSGSTFCHVEFAEGPAVDRAMKLSLDRMGGAKIRIDYAENRKLDPGASRALVPLPPPGYGMPPMQPGVGPPGMPPLGYPPPYGMPMHPGMYPPPFGAPPPPPGGDPRGPPPPGWTGPPRPPASDGASGGTPPARPPMPGWPAAPYGYPPPDYYGRPLGPPGSYWGAGPPPPGYPGGPPPMGYPGPPGAVAPSSAPPAGGRGRSRSAGSYTYSYSYTPSPSPGRRDRAKK